jgi:peptidoglycan/xylan/chitin deacetylase (PgdA/CDA1 family)
MMSPMASREWLAAQLHRAGALDVVNRLRRLARVPVITIVTYHHIAELDPGYPSDPEVADATPAQFRAQLEALARFGAPITLGELRAALAGGPLPRNPFMVTFDDGYRSCHDVALPILEAVGLPATFFVASSFIEERRLYWWERTALIRTRARRPRVTLSYPHPRTIDLRAPTAVHALNDVIKDSPGLDVTRFLDELAHAADAEWDAAIERDYADRQIMTWDHVRALGRAGMDLGSHTRHHRVLQTLDDAALRDELAGSRADLERRLDRPVTAIAYPVGRRIVHHARLRQAVVDAGYELGFTNASGVSARLPRPLRGLAPLDPLDLRRMSTDREMSHALFCAQLAIPPMAYTSKHHGR